MSNERKRDSNFIPNRIDHDPPVLLGVTSPELTLLGYISIPAFLLGAVLTFVFSDTFVYAILGGVFIAIIALFGSLFFLIAYKRNKPRNYVLHRKQILLSRLGLKHVSFIYKSELFSSKDDD